MPKFNLKDLKKIIFNKLSKNQYEKAIEDGLVKDDEFYLTPDTTEQDIADAIEVHNTSTEAHNDIRTSIKDATLTIKQNDTVKGTFSANASEDVEINIEADPQEQADWTEEDEIKASFIKNKPTLGTASEKDVDFFATSAQGELADTALQPEDVINDVTHTDTDLPLSANMGKELNDRLNAIAARGRFLSTWDSTTGLAGTTPTTLPYTYKTGDYFIVKKVAAVEQGGKNYKPDGTTYTGEASTAEETNSIAVNDTYYYDGTTWSLLHGADVQVTFASIAGDPYDNTNLAGAFNEKQDTLIAGENITIDEDGKTISATDTTYTAGDGIEISEDNKISAKVYSEEANIVYGTDNTGNQIVYTEGSGIEFLHNEIIVPDEYYQLEYVTSLKDEETGISPIIDTGYLPESRTFSNTKIESEVRFERITTAVSGCVFGIQPSNTYGIGIYSYNVPGKPYYFSWNFSNAVGRGSETISNIETYEFYKVRTNNGVCTINDTDIYDTGISSISVSSSEGNFALFGNLGRSSSPMYSNASLKRTKLTDNDVLIFDYVPAMRKSDNKVGMYDLVTNTFKTSSNEYELVAGPIVSAHTINAFGTGSVKSSDTPSILYGNDQYSNQKNYSAGNNIEFDDLSDIPDTYNILDFVRPAPGNYFNTGLYFNNSDDIEVYIKTSQDGGGAYTNYKGIFGSKSTNYGFSLEYSQSITNYPIMFNYKGSEYSVGKLYMGSDINIWIKNNAITINGIDINRNKASEKLVAGPNSDSTTTRTSIPSTYPIYLCAVNDPAGVKYNANTNSTTIHRFKFWKNKVLTVDYVPVQRKSDKVNGLYDRVSKAFITTSVISGSGKTQGCYAGSKLLRIHNIEAKKDIYYAGDGIEITKDGVINSDLPKESKIVYGTDVNKNQIVYSEGKNIEFEDYGGLLTNSSYKPIEYIKSTSTAPSYITTGISFLSNHQYETEVVFQFLTTTTSGGGLLGRVANTSSTGLAYGLGIESGKYVAYYGVTSGENNKHTTSTSIDTNKHTLVIRDGQFTLDGVLIYEHIVTNITPAIDNFTIGTITSSSSQMSSINNAVIYSVKIKDLTTNTVLGMWVPVKNTGNAVGLWNTVAKNFNSNSLWSAGSNIDLKAKINSLSKEYTAGKGINISTGGVITNTSPASEKLHISYGLTKYEIPVGYSAVEYLDFDGTDFFRLLSTASTTSIDGRMNWNGKTEVTLIFEALENPTTEAPLFGTYYTSSSGGHGYWGVSLANDVIKGYAAENSKTIPLVLGQKITFKYKKSSSQISLNGTVISATSSGGSYLLPSGVKIGNFDSDPITRTGGKFRLYEYKTTLANKISADVIPVIRNSDGVAGLYEMVSGTFITPVNKNDGITAGTLAPDTAGLTIDTDRVLFNVADDPTSIIEGKIFQGRDGSGILTSGIQAVAIGANVFVNNGSNCVVIGYGTSSTSGYSVILGCKAKSSWSTTTEIHYKEGAVVIGNEAVVNAPGGIVIGALSPYTTANQRQSATQARDSIVIGYESYVNSAPHSVVLGDHSYIHTNDVSQHAVTSSTKNVVIGSYSCVSTDNVYNAVVLGSDASASANNSIQIGAGTNNLSGTLKIRDTYLLWDSGKVNFEVLSRVTPTNGQVLCYDEDEDGQGNLLSWKTLEQYTLTPATTTKLGGVIVGDYLNITSTGKLSVNVATEDQLGVVQPDGTTIEVDEDGEISVPAATNTTLGLVKPDNETIVVENGVISAKTNKIVVVNDRILSRDADGVIAWTIEHNLGTQDVMCSVKMMNDGLSEEIYPRIIYDDDEITLYFNSDSAFLPNEIKVVIIG